MEKFQVIEEKIKVLTATIVRGKGITTTGGWFGSLETPDPYVKIRVRTSPNAQQQTTSKTDDPNPVWNELFTFYLNPEKKNTLEMILMDEDFGYDDVIGNQTVELDDLPMNKEIKQLVKFSEKASVEIKLLIGYNETLELRFSYDLCEEEKDFLKKRKEEVLKNMSNVLQKSQMPKSVNEVPTIAIMGSGGGYRAMCGLSGVFCALEETGIVDCATYVTGLSGSSWYISTLYSHDGWPQIKCADVAPELRDRFNTNILSHFKLEFRDKMNEKRKRGQIVRFTDLFGMAIGNALLHNNEAKLGYQVQKVAHGNVPLPICTGIRCQKDVSAKLFSEWVEFSPFEFGMAKFGIFGKTSDFGGKYYKGQLVKKFEESPLHFLQGIWGSAFSILLSQVISGDKKNTTEAGHKELLEKEIGTSVDKLKNEDDGSEDEAEDEIEHENWLTEMLNPTNIFSSREGKAAEVFNFCRGLSFKSKNETEFHHLSGSQKTMCIVDSGIAFNSPYPTLIREEREVDLILSFDFSQRDGGDTALPFKELLLAEQWAKEHNLPFPPIESNPVTKDTNLQECYVFDNPEDPKCPTILHFPLINKTFKNFTKPGVPRVTQEEKDFGNFSIFDDPEQPYSSFTFQYENKTFDRLHELTKFNTLLNIDLIKEKIVNSVQVRQNNPR